MKLLKRLTMMRATHPLFGPSEFPIKEVKGEAVIIPTLPHHGKPMIRTVISGHCIGDMMKEERQGGEECSRDTHTNAVMSDFRTQAAPSGILLLQHLGIRISTAFKPGHIVCSFHVSTGP